MRRLLLAAAIALAPITARAQFFTTLPNATQTITSSQTVLIPAGAHYVDWEELGGGGGSGCGIVEPSGTASTGGATGGTGVKFTGRTFLPSVGNPTSIAVVIGAAGTSCIASGTTAGSTGSTPTAGGTTTITFSGGIELQPAFGGGAGANATTGAYAGGGGTGGPQSTGGNGGSGTAGNGGGTGAVGGGSGSGGEACPVNYGVLAGCSGSGSALGVQNGVNFGYVSLEMPTSGGPGQGLNATPAALNGTQGTASWMDSIYTQRGNPGSNSCNGTQNATNSTWKGFGLYGVGGSGGASCTAANGGSGGAAAGFGATGGGGSSTEPGFTAGSGGLSVGGGVRLTFG